MARFVNAVLVGQVLTVLFPIRYALAGQVGPLADPVTQQELSSGSPVTGSLRSFSWNYYHINVAQGGTGLDVSVE